MRFRNQPPLFFHPILIGLYPILSLLAGNLDQVRPVAAVRAGLLSLGGCLLLYGMLHFALHAAGKNATGINAAATSAGRAAVLTTLWLVLFTTYGHLYQLAEGRALFGFVYGKHRYFLALWLLLFLLGTWAVLTRLRQPRPVNTALNLAGAVLLLFPLFQIGQFAYRTQAADTRAAVTPAAAPGGAQAPNIYYIVLDGYTRADGLRDRYDLDITPFMDDLRSLGFVFPQCAQSNYGMTAFSMFASLNMDYLTASPYAATIPLGSVNNQVDTSTMHEYLRHSQVRHFLAQRGYAMVTFETGYWWLDIDDADMFIVGNDNPLEKYAQNYDVSAFEEMYVRSTALRVAAELLPRLSGKGAVHIRTANQRHYDLTSFAMDQLEQTPRIPGKKFVYFHLVAPHAPFVFDAQGNYVDYDRRNGDIPAYPNEVMYLNQSLPRLIRALIAAEETPPIIILQADHGWDPRERMKILSAYHLPGGGNALLYPSITPVNTFRLIFNHYFGADFPLLKDESFFSIGHEFPELGLASLPYKMTPVPGSCMEK